MKLTERSTWILTGIGIASLIVVYGLLKRRAWLVPGYLFRDERVISDFYENIAIESMLTLSRAIEELKATIEREALRLHIDTEDID